MEPRHGLLAFCSLLLLPLLALMRNQIAAAERMGVRAATLNSDNADGWQAIEEAVQRNEVDILFISPELRILNAETTQTAADPKNSIAICSRYMYVHK
jgi:superfamily II DNA helicase RecQ